MLQLFACHRALPVKDYYTETDSVSKWLILAGLLYTCAISQRLKVDVHWPGRTWRTHSSSADAFTCPISYPESTGSLVSGASPGETLGQSNIHWIFWLAPSRTIDKQEEWKRKSGFSEIWPDFWDRNAHEQREKYYIKATFDRKPVFRPLLEVPARFLDDFERWAGLYLTLAC